MASFRKDAMTMKQLRISARYILLTSFVKSGFNAGISFLYIRGIIDVYRQTIF